MPRKAKASSAEATAATKRKRRSSDHAEDNEGEGKTRTKRGGALSKFEEFDVSEVMQKCPDPPAEEEAPLASAPVPEPEPEPEPEPVPEPEVRLEPELLPLLLPPSPPPPIPQLIPPEPLRDLPEDEEFVPLPAIQVIPSMNRAAEAQNGLLKEPAPPSNIQRVTQPGMLAPAMPTALMQLLSA